MSPIEKKDGITNLVFDTEAQRLAHFYVASDVGKQCIQLYPTVRNFEIVTVTAGVATYSPLVSSLAAGSALIAITASRAAILTDAFNVIVGNHATVAIEVTVPNDATAGWARGERISTFQKGAAATGFTAGADVTFRNSAPAAAQYQLVTIQRVGTNEWAYV